MAEGQKWGANHAKGMFFRGLDELRSMSFWEGSNVAQVNHSASFYGPPAAGSEKSGFERAVEQSRGGEGPAQAEPAQEAERSRGHGR